MNIEIKSVKIKDSKPEITYFPLDENGNHLATQTFESGPKCHDDFVKKVDKLAIHLALLTFTIKPGSVKNIENYEDKETIIDGITVNGFHIGGKDEDQNIIIVGGRKLPNGKYLGLNSPMYRFNEDEATRYKFMDDLQLLLEDCKDEARLYISGEKVWKDPQQTLFADDKGNISNGNKTEDSQETV